MTEPAPLRVAITGATGQTALALLLPIASGRVFGDQQPICLTLLDQASASERLSSLCADMRDCVLPLLREIVPTDNPDVAFKNADYALLVGAVPRKDGMERKDLLKQNVKIFKAQGRALDAHAKRTCRVLVIGNPTNTNAFIVRHFAPSLPAKNFSALSRLDQNRARSQIASRLGLPNWSVKRVAIWGNHSNRLFADAAHATVRGLDGRVRPATEAVANEEWLKGDFLTTVQRRGAEVLRARKRSSASSAAKAVCDHLRDWHFGTPDGDFSNMAVVSDGAYGIPEGLVFSFPTVVADGEWRIVRGLAISDWAMAKLKSNAKELAEERDIAMSVCE